MTIDINPTMYLCLCVRLRFDDLLSQTCNYLRNPVLPSISVVHCAVLCADSFKQHGGGENITNHSCHNTIRNLSIWFLSQPKQNIISSEDCRGGRYVAWLCPRHASLHNWMKASPMLTTLSVCHRCWSQTDLEYWWTSTNFHGLARHKSKKWGER